MQEKLQKKKKKKKTNRNQERVERKTYKFSTRSYKTKLPITCGVYHCHSLNTYEVIASSPFTLRE